MGADGGSIAKRSDIVKSASAHAIEEDRESKKSLWTQCSLSHQKLEDPVVSDYNGALYNKTAILEFLIGNHTGPKPDNSPVSQIRDVVELKREFDRDRWIDPISRKNLEQEGMSERFAYLAECGHVLPVSVLLKRSSCPVCEAHYEDIVILNPQTADSRQRNQMRIEKLTDLGLSNSLRPLKKPQLRKRHRASREDGSISDASKARKTTA